MSVQDYREKFDALQIRERLLVLFVVVALVYALWTLLIDDSQSRKFVQLNQQLQTARTSIQSQNLALATAQANQHKDPDAELKRQLAQLQLDLQSMDEQLTRAAVGLVPASELPRVLEQMVLQTSGLRLQRLETLPIEQLPFKEISPEQEAGPATGVFRHAVRLELDGTYFAVQQYIEALQKLHWRFYWDSLSYAVERYPRGRAQLVVYTLSTERGAIGD